MVVLSTVLNITNIILLLMILIDCWKYRHISASVETNSQGTDQEMAEHVRETGDGGVDRCLNHLNVKNLLQLLYARADNFVR